MTAAIETIRWALGLVDESTTRLVGDLRDAPLTRSTPNGGNHALWVVGHLAVIEGMVPHVVSGGPNPVQHWWPLFGTGSRPSDDGSAYPPFDEVLAAYRDLRARNLALLEEIGEEGLGRAPRSVPAGFEDDMRTIGRAFHLVALHQMFHLGQAADARRAAGREPFV